jgi:hypothetical protein
VANGSRRQRSVKMMGALTLEAIVKPTVAVERGGARHVAGRRRELGVRRKVFQWLRWFICFEVYLFRGEDEQRWSRRRHTGRSEICCSCLIFVFVSLIVIFILIKESFVKLEAENGEFWAD